MDETVVKVGLTEAKIHEFIILGYDKKRRAKTTEICSTIVMRSIPKKPKVREDELTPLVVNCLEIIQIECNYFQSEIRLLFGPRGGKCHFRG